MILDRFRLDRPRRRGHRCRSGDRGGHRRGPGRSRRRRGHLGADRRAAQRGGGPDRGDRSAGRGGAGRPERPRCRGRPGSGRTGGVRPARHRRQQRRRDHAERIPGDVAASSGAGLPLQREHAPTRWSAPRCPSCSPAAGVPWSTSRRPWGGLQARGFVAYGTAKAALAHYTRLAAADLAPRIRVNAIAVGSVATSALDVVLQPTTACGRRSRRPRRCAGSEIPRTSPRRSSTCAPRPGLRHGQGRRGRRWAQPPQFGHGSPRPVTHR